MQLCCSYVCSVSYVKFFDDYIERKRIFTVHALLSQRSIVIARAQI